jgi:hypothetical protein
MGWLNIMIHTLFHDLSTTATLIARNYVQWIFSWWWFFPALVVSILLTVYLLKLKAPMSLTKALWMTFVGIIGCIPFVRAFIPIRFHIEFIQTWKSRPRFFPFFMGTIATAFLLGPFFAIPVFFAIMHLSLAEIMDLRE